MKNENEENYNLSRDNELRHSTGSMKGSKRMEVNMHLNRQSNGIDGTSVESIETVPPSVHNLIKGFQTKIVSTSSKSSKDQTDHGGGFHTPGYVVDSPILDSLKSSSSKRKLSLRNKKNKLTQSEARFTILQSLGMSPFVGNEHRCLFKAFAYFDLQSLFFNMQNAAALKLQYDEGGTVQMKLSGASAASQRNNPGRKRFKSGEFDPQIGRFRSRGESMIDEGDNKANHLILNCPYFRNEIPEPEETDDTKTTYTKTGKDITKLISMFNRNRSYENIRNDSYDVDKKYARRRTLESSEQDILLESIEDDSNFFSWDEPNVSGKQIFDFEHIDRGAMFYREYFHNKEHSNLFGIDEKYGPIAISITRQVLPKMAILSRTNETNSKNQNKRHQYRVIMRTCELYSLRISVLENSIPSTSRHNATRSIPLKDVLEHCFPEIQSSCLKHCAQTPKVGEQLLKLDEQQLSLTYKIGLLYCKVGQKTEEEMYNNETGGSEFLEFCSVIADKVALKGFQGYRAQLDNKNDSTGQHSLYTTFHGREIMFHVSTELPFTANDRQQLLRKRHIGNDIVTVVFQEAGSEPFTPQMMRSHFQHVFIVVRVENPHTENTKYEVAVSRSRDVPYFGPPVPPNKFTKTATFREFLLTKLINAENAAHKSEKFTHMARRTRYGYLKDLAQNHVSTQALETSTKFGFSFTSKKKEKTAPPVNPEIWLQGGLVWNVKFEYDDDTPASVAYLSISTKSITFVEQSSQDILASISCKTVLGWKPTSHTLKLFYDNGKMVYFSLINDDLHELPYVINRLKAVTPGCETQDLSLRRNNDGQLGFHVFYEGLVAEVEPYGLAWHSGLRKGSRLLEISGNVVCKMSHERMILMLKRPGAVRIVVLPPAPDGQPRNYKAVRNMRRYSSMTSVYSMSVNNMTGIGEELSSSGLSSSKENLQGSSEVETDRLIDTTNKMRSLSMEASVPRITHHSSSSEISDSSSSDPPKQTLSPRKKNINSSQERIIASRSATDISTVSAISPQVPLRSNTTTPMRSKTAIPQTTLDQEWGDLERNLTDARKSIDAKFYRSLANSQSPFFKASRPPGLMSPDEIVSPEESDEVFKTTSTTSPKNTSNTTSPQNTAKVYTRRVSEVHYPIVNEKINIKVMNDKVTISGTSESTYTSSHSKQSSIDSSTDRTSVNKNNFEFEAPGYAIVDAPKQTAQTIDTNVNKDQTSFSDSSLNSYSQSQENLTSEKDSDSNKNKGSIVKTKVRDAKEIIKERIHNSPVVNRREKFIQSRSLDAAPVICTAKTIKTGVSVAARKQIFASGETEENRSSSPVRSSRVESPTHIHFRNKSDPNINPLRRQSATLPQTIPRMTTSQIKKRPVASRLLSQETNSSIGKSPDNMIKFDESLSETFAKIDAAFGFKSTTPVPATRDEKRKKRKQLRRRSRNCEPPTSDSSEDNDLTANKRNSRSFKKFLFDDNNSLKGPKSEAEESLEAAISDFQMSLKRIPDDKKAKIVSNSEATIGSYSSGSPKCSKRSTLEDDPPKVPTRTSKPQILSDMKRLRNQMRTGSDSVNDYESNGKSKIDSSKRPLSEGNIITNNRPESPLYRPSSCITSLRPWTPTQSKHDSSDSIRENVTKCTSSTSKGNKPAQLHLVKETEITDDIVTATTIIEDQLSPLPYFPITPTRGGIHSLPHRKNKKRSTTVTYDTMVRSSSASCIPLVVRGLDLAACKNALSTGSWSKEDMHVMLTVMENELEQEREEKERLAEELDRSREEKDRLLEQSKQAANQLRKFTSLFLDSTPQEAKEKYTATADSR